jgi:hypothetical protein
MSEVKPNIFLSWSGERSLRIAEILVEWLRVVIPEARPFFSPELEKGVPWEPDLEGQLSSISAGIVCLTPENLSTPYIHWEAGKLSKSMETARVYTYLYDLSPGEVRKPLSQFQHTLADSKNETLKLAKSISEFLQSADNEQIITKRVELAWPNWDSALKAVKSQNEPERHPLPLPVMTAEVLDLSREWSREGPKLFSALSSTLTTSLNHLETNLESGLKRLESDIEKLSVVDKLSAGFLPTVESNKKAIQEVQGRVAGLENKQQGDHVSLFWRRLAFDCANPDSKDAQSPIYVTFCNEPPQWSLKNDDPRGFRSGSGEVAAAFELARVFASAGLNFDVLRSRKLSLDILAKPDFMLIVFGSTLEFKNLNSIRGQIWPGLQRFEFGWERVKGGGAKFDGFIRDNSTAEKLFNTKGLPEEQYAVVSVMRNARRQRFVNLAGISTLGTEAAVKFLCDPVTLGEVLGKVSSSDGSVVSFEALLKVPIHYDVPYVPEVLRMAFSSDASETPTLTSAAATS